MPNRQMPEEADAYQVLYTIMINGGSNLADIEKTSESTTGYKTERAILVGLEVATGKTANGISEQEKSLDELEELSATAGVMVVGKILQKKQSIDPATFIGSGKLEELNSMCAAMEADVVIFDDELTGAQIRNIENKVGIKVIDRTVLILDIFAKRARSREGKLQVELAQLKYRLPRLTGLGSELSRLGGGIGTRGPGETKLETDRRHIRRRISYLENELKEVDKQRNLLRSGKKRSQFPVIALVGYTNAGKSTLMNRLCDADVYADDKLFATLDPTTRKMTLDEEKTILLVDTVGFIRKLPHELINAFKSTLDEVVYADALLHVVDASDADFEKHIEVADNLLKSLGVLEKPAITVFNKIDLVDRTNWSIPWEKRDNSVEISAATGFGIETLVQKIVELIESDVAELDLLIPYEKGNIVTYIHENGAITSKEYTEEGFRIKARIDKDKSGILKDYLI
jgi:GTP-binding protein HflX